jgi:exopolyphosphatase/guanosine-5'-triphosphate,3'-diphosphate pyrophosphatase
MAPIPLSNVERCAIIDLGTNTFNLLIVDVVTDNYKVVLNTKMAVKIGEGAMIKNELQPEPMHRAKAALRQHLSTISEYACQKTYAFATSAIRSAKNGSQFVSEVKNELGLEVRVISGDEEAQLIYEGVNLAIPFGTEPMLIMDIGGGSTEFIIANSEGVKWKRSYDLGISRLLQILTPSDPVTATDLEKFDAFLSTELPEMMDQCANWKVRALIGSSGSFDSFIEMIWASKGIDRLAKDVVSDEFNLHELKALNDRLIGMGFDQRKAIPGLVEMRVDTIHLASHMVQWVMQQCQLERLLLSTYALKEGVLHRIMKNTL